jgi:hypothetical protein
MSFEPQKQCYFGKTKGTTSGQKDPETQENG